MVLPKWNRWESASLFPPRAGSRQPRRFVVELTVPVHRALRLSEEAVRTLLGQRFAVAVLRASFSAPQWERRPDRPRKCSHRRVQYNLSTLVGHRYILSYACGIGRLGKFNSQYRGRSGS